MPRRRTRRASPPVLGFLVVFVAVLGLSGCGLVASDDDASEPTPTAATDPLAATTTTPTAVVPEGLPIQTFELKIGDCFNRYDEIVTEAGEAAGTRTTKVPCTTPHGNEVIALLTRPEDATQPFPGTTALTEWAQTECYAIFPTVLGIDYEVSRYEIGSFVPTESQWVEGLYRTVHCYVFLPDEQTTGTVRGIGR